MTQLEKSAPRTFVAEYGASRQGRFQLLSIGLIVLICAIALAGFAFARDGTPSPEPVPQAQAVTDGWMAGITAANRAAQLAAADRVRDGWSSYLLQPEAEVVDGWATRYLVDDD